MSNSFKLPSRAEFSAFIRGSLKAVGGIVWRDQSAVQPSSPAKLPGQSVVSSGRSPIGELLTAFLPAEVRELQKLHAEIAATKAELATAEARIESAGALLNSLCRQIGLAPKDLQGKPVAEVQRLVSRRLASMANEQVASLGFAVPI